ncbi:MAG: ATP-dependent Clp protease adaptor ClpS [Cytophagales bacterium]|nr:MAG: ATP-dependent Clp protease adaptor ClpS [Cytophagales bacterium]TAF59372.1 MAG: ATP-dependent Clp protease adaptor ClpS [Cytophagales bacterium]
MTSKIRELSNQTKTITEEELLVLLDAELERELVLFNDQINSFEHVIRTLVMVSGLSLQRAFEIAHAAHNFGYATIKLGTFNELVKEREAICAEGIWAEVL